MLPEVLAGCVMLLLLHCRLVRFRTGSENYGMIEFGSDDKPSDWQTSALSHWQ